MSESYCVILSTAGSLDEANRLAELLVERKLAACVQIANISSVYRWQGQVKKEAECLLFIKTASHLHRQVEAAIVENHSYEIPEVIQIPITNGLERYLGWIGENTK
jgi:periplasmic divalent cation tolerance protein